MILQLQIFHEVIFHFGLTSGEVKIGKVKHACNLKKFQAGVKFHAGVCFTSVTCNMPLKTNIQW